MSVNLVFHDRTDLKRFIDTINAAKIETLQGGYVQWQTVQSDADALDLYEFEVLPAPDAASRTGAYEGEFGSELG
jgi:hypothetical protein